MEIIVLDVFGSKTHLRFGEECLEADDSEIGLPDDDDDFEIEQEIFNTINQKDNQQGEYSDFES